VLFGLVSERAADLALADLAKSSLTFKIFSGIFLVTFSAGKRAFAVSAKRAVQILDTL
jgi:hypothetical protein